MSDDLPDFTIGYSRRTFFGYGVAFLILAYGGVGMVSGLIAVDAGQRFQQILIGLVFLVLAVCIGVFLFSMFRMMGKPVLILKDDGLWDRRLTVKPIPWSDIQSIERVEPGMVERLVLLGGMTGKIVICVVPEARDRIGFVHPWQAFLHAFVLAGDGRLRLIHKPLDAQYAQLSALLMQKWQIAHGRRSDIADGTGSTSAENRAISA